MTFVPINLPSPAIRGPTQIGVCRSYYHRRTNVRTGTPARCPGPWVDIPGGRLRPLSRILFRAFVASGPHVGAGVTGEGVEAVLAAEPVPLAGVVAEELGAQQGDAHAADGVDGLLDRCRRHGGAPVALADQLREHRDRDLLLRRRRARAAPRTRSRRACGWRRGRCSRRGSAARPPAPPRRSGPWWPPPRRRRDRPSRARAPRPRRRRPA